jgi:hypothetical protein
MGRHRPRRKPRPPTTRPLASVIREQVANERRSSRPIMRRRLTLAFGDEGCNADALGHGFECAVLPVGLDVEHSHQVPIAGFPPTLFRKPRLDRRLAARQDQRQQETTGRAGCPTRNPLSARVLNETIARDHGAGDAKLLDGRSRRRSFRTQSSLRATVRLSSCRRRSLVSTDEVSAICGLAQPKLVSRAQYFSMPHPVNPVFRAVKSKCDQAPHFGPRPAVALDRHKKTRNWQKMTGATPGFERQEPQF